MSSPRLTQLSTLDKLWLLELSHGVITKQLMDAPSEQMAKNRLISIRQFLGAGTTTEAVAIAIRKGVIR